MKEYSLLLGFVKALLMVIGICGLGGVIVKTASDKLSSKFSHILSGTEFLLGVIVISVGISWASLFFTGHITYQAFGIVILFAGVLTILKIIVKLRKYRIYIEDFKKIPKLDWALLISLPLFYILANSGDVTNADSIDYHVGYALNYLKANYDPHPEWYNGRMASIGEKINAIGLSVYSLQFGPLMQIAGYVSIAVILAGVFSDREKNKYLMPLALMSAPVFLFLGTSAKPQILPTALSCLSFYLIHSLEKFNWLLYKDKYIIISTSFLLSSVAFTHKFSFIISLTFIVMYIYWICIKYKIKFITCCILLTLVLLIVIFPAYYDKNMRYGSNLFEYFLNPVSSNESSLIYFIETARHYKESKFVFPIYLIIPDSFGKVSTVLGVGVLIAAIPIFLNKIVSNFLRALIGLNIFVLALVSMPSSRFFLEIYIWLLIVLGLSGYLFSTYNTKLIRAAIYLQSTFVIVCLMPISFYASGQVLGLGVTSFKERFVNGYNLYKWYDAKIDSQESILLDHRSGSLTSRNVVSMEAYEFSKNTTNNFDTLTSQLIKYGVKYAVTVEKSESFNKISNCSAGQKFGPEKLRISTRNPFNSDYEYGYVFSIDPIPFVECLRRE